MAEERNKSRAEQPKIRLDELTARAVPDPKNPEEALLVAGFVGASSEPEKTRIYWDASLSTYVDVDTADILHSEPLTKEQSPLGGSYIWLKRNAQVFFGSAGGQTTKGKFFEGPLMAAYSGQFGAAAGPGTAAPGAGLNLPYSLHVYCNPTPFCTQVVGCWQSPYYPCVSYYCTRYVECRPTLLCPVNTAAGCFLTPNCPVASPGCPPVGPGTPVQGQGAGFGAFAAMPQAAALPQPGIPSLVCSYSPGCWYSWGACPTQVGCGGPPHTPKLQAEMAPAALPQPGIPSLVCSYSPGCWYSWGACPTQGGWCGPYHTPNCPRLEAGIAGPAIQWTGWPCGSGYICPPPHSIGSCGHACTM